MTNHFISTNHAEDVAGSVRQAIRMNQFLNEDSQAWKWAILALHSALQGACVCHLTRTAECLGATTKQNTKDWLKYFEERRRDIAAQPPKIHIMPLPDLLKAVRKCNSAGDGRNDSSINITEGDFNLLRHLHDDIRNQFTHFEPMNWAIETSGISEIGKLISRIITDIFNAGWGFRHQNEEWRQEFQLTLKILAGLAWPV
ncbi:hypothetical protein KY084_07080 [Stakelama sp. CBK3Z-3]|uniref:HEPN AbiU2-like domain-containing protein n=1 Tax=Stakelama flava TaxID=2860338 RepID=A0ABS6XKA5_9SPHN|nr:hypothetical protein [Stakelama flava]MBW4330639.1 hypothetical protein [Stakelama flava]